jgi:murein L,D-transpeptidase YcbB/YkuD
LEYCRRKGCSIADEKAQVEFAIAEFKTEYAPLWSFLCTCGEDQLYTATERVCREFERPAYNNVRERFSDAKALRDTIQSKAVESIDNTVVIPKTETSWPPRMICNGMFGNDVAVLQALLRAHGYTLSDSSGIFGDSTETALIKYQADYGLDADGIAGPMTWASITRI